MRSSRCLFCLGIFRLEHSPPRNTMPISGARRRAGRKEWLAHNGLLDGFPEITTLFTAGAQVTANATEHLRSMQRTEAPGDFLTYLDHADVLLGLVVGKGHSFIPQEGQHRSLKILQSVQ